MEKDLERFQEKYFEDVYSGCFRWIAGTVNGGYGAFWLDGQMVRAHRYAYEMAYGPIPEGMDVCHTCDTPGCVNFAHLFLGTASDNLFDAVGKGRWNAPRGEKHVFHKLTEKEVLEIREATDRPVDVAAQYGVSVPTVCNIKSRRKWGWL